jgi:hypothetical protein
LQYRKVKRGLTLVQIYGMLLETWQMVGDQCQVLVKNEYEQNHGQEKRQMKRIESYIQRNYWLLLVLRLMLFALLCFWVIPGMLIGRSMLGGLRKEAAEARRYPYSREKQFAANEVANQCLRRAYKLDSAYGPQHYFPDIAKIIGASRGVLQPQSQITGMQQIMMGNLHDKRFSDDDLTYWQRKVQSQLNYPKPGGKMPTWQETLWWLLIAYLKVVLLVLVAYLLRMIDHRGILKTVLSDKGLFLKALFDWPHHFWEYPTHVIREAQVEAELRRIGNLFRRLNPVERLAIREIASSKNFKERLWALREAHQPEYQRGLAVALLATLCLLILPRVSEAKTSNAGANPQGIVMAVARAGPTVQVVSVRDHPPPVDWSGEVSIPELWELLDIGSEPFSFRDEGPPKLERLNRIDHVPEVILVGERRLRVVQRQGERTDEIMVHGRPLRSAEHLTRAGLGYQPG